MKRETARKENERKLKVYLSKIKKNDKRSNVKNR
tara:strand:- start:6521 stop:6622 length:102 start_codon:yes stop_codon:yes gene_type:complete